MAKFGPSSVFFFVDGYDMLLNKVQGIDWEDEAPVEKTNGLGDSWEEHTPVGKRVARLVQEGAFFDTATGRIHDALASSIPADPDDTPRIICVGLMGATIGALFTGFEGAFGNIYKVLAKNDELTKADVEYAITGKGEEGVILQPLAQQTADWNTEATPVDNGSGPTTNGGTAYMQVTESTGFTNFVGTVRDSPDDITYSDLVAFPDSVVDPYGARVEVAGNVERYLAFDGNVTGTGTITAFAGFKRNP